MYSEYLRRSFFCCFIWFVFRHWVTPAAPLRSWMERRKFQCQWLNSLFILANMLNLELSRGQKFVPDSPNDTPFEKWLSTSAIFIIILLFPPCFCSSLSFFFFLSDRHAMNDAVLFFIYKICWVDYYREDPNSLSRKDMLQQCLWKHCALTWVAVENQ